MNREKNGDGERMIKNSLFPLSLFAIFLGVLFLMSGIHVGLVVLMNDLGWSEIIQTIVPMLYWGIVAVGLTLFTRKKIKSTYEEPLHRLAGVGGRFLGICSHGSYGGPAGLSGCDDPGLQ